MREWAQYYTPGAQSSRLIGELPAPTMRQSATTVMDLGAGQGDLLAAAYQRWPSAQLLGVDIDKRNVATIRHRLPGIRCLTADALKFDLPKRLGIDENSTDIAVANPPYGALESGSKVIKVLRQAGLDDVVSEKRISRELIFLAQNLRLLRPGGSLVAVVPQGLGTAPHLAELRAALMQRHGLYKVVELPAKTFAGTEARTLALFMTKGASSQVVEYVPASGTAHCLDVAQIRERIDAKFHQRTLKLSTNLLEIGAEIVRGSLTHKDAQKLRWSAFHTTDFHQYPSGLAKLPGTACPSTKFVSAEKGDILLARVGTRCLGKMVWVKSGTAVLTDCVYRIRVEPIFQKQIFNALRSTHGQDWLASIAHGTCAFVVSKRDLEQFPF